jgi:isopenicillin N synthase-like dioxygenase
MVSGVSITDKAVGEIARNGFVLLDISSEFQELIQGAFDAGAKFFESDTDSKATNCLPFDTGYRPYGQEYSQTNTHPDEMESFTASYRVRNPEHLLSSIGARELHARMLSVFDGFESAAEEITSRLALSIDNRPRDLRCGFRMWSLLQFNYSRPSQTTAEFINDLHEDGCLLTIMSIAGSGLELRSETGFTSIAASKQQVLVMAGEILWLLTGGEINPVYHRVRTVPSHLTRKSLLFFADMNPAICDPWVFSDVNRNVDIGKRVLKNSSRFGLSEWRTDG